MRAYQLMASCVLMTLLGCVSVVPPKYSLEQVSRPSIGEATKRDVGEYIIEDRNVKGYDGINFASPKRFDAGGLSNIFELRGQWIESKRSNGDVLYCGTAQQISEFLGSNGYVGPVKNWCFLGSRFHDQGLDVSKTTVYENDPSNFVRVLTYSGRIGSQINVSYREFSGDMARPAFTQDLIFDIGRDRFIGAKGARIEVISADNMSITYKVIQSFSNR